MNLLYGLVCRKGVLSREEEEENEEEEETNEKFMRVCRLNCPDHNYLNLLKLKMFLISQRVRNHRRLHAMTEVVIRAARRVEKSVEETKFCGFVCFIYTTQTPFHKD